MIYNNVDVILSQKLTSLVPTEMVMYYTRVNDEDGIEPNFLNLVRILRAFILSKEIVEQDTLPAQLNAALKSFMSKKESDVVQSDVNSLFALFEFYNYSIKVVGRLDLNGKVAEEITDDQMAYVLASYAGNNTETPGFYMGYSKLYDISRRPLAMDFLIYFNLTQEQIAQFDLVVPSKTYEIYSRENRLNDFDDTIAQEFLKANKMEFVVERTI